MTALRDKILKAWDDAISQFARKRDDPTDVEIDVATAIVCAKCPGVTADDIRNAIRTSVEELKGKVASLDRVLQILEGMVTEESKGTLPGLPCGPPLKR
jgi:hypothetical protein